jgi:hypothetical protein
MAAASRTSVSEVKRQKKDGEDKNKKNDRMREGTPDPRQNVDRPGVHEDAKGPDSFDADLKRTSSKADKDTH